MITFEKAKSLLKDKKSIKVTKKITLVKKTRKVFVLKYGKTSIVEINSDNTYVVRNGGDFTKSMLTRLNKYTPAKITGKRGKWCFDTLTNYYNGAKLNTEGEVMIPDPARKFAPNECRECGMTRGSECRCPLSPEAFRRVQRQAMIFERDYGYIPDTYRELLRRGASNG